MFSDIMQKYSAVFLAFEGRSKSGDQPRGRSKEVNRKGKYQFSSRNLWPLFLFKTGQFSTLPEQFQKKKEVPCFMLTNVMKSILR